LQLAETFKLTRKILTEQLVPRQTACFSMTFWLLLLGAKPIAIINVVAYIS